MEPTTINIITTIIVTIITVLGSASAFKFYEKRMSIKRQKDNYIKDDCEKRIKKLELLLEKSSEEKELMRKQILTLSNAVAALKVEVEFLRKEKKVRKR